MDIGKVYEYQEDIEENMTFEEQMKLCRELLYSKYEELEDSDSIHCYQLLRGMIDIFTQMCEGRVFDKGYLEDTIKW